MSRFQSRWLAWQGAERAPTHANRGAKSDRSSVQDTFGTFGTAVSQKSAAQHVPALDADAGELAAVKLRNTIIGDVWLVADAEALADHPDIIRSALPVLFFDELEQLRGKAVAELQAIGMVKATFPTSRVLQ